MLEDRILLSPNDSSFYRFEEIKRNIDKVNKQYQLNKSKVLMQTGRKSKKEKRNNSQ